jgi:hypothetical protein
MKVREQEKGMKEKSPRARQDVRQRRR